MSAPAVERAGSGARTVVDREAAIATEAARALAFHRWGGRSRECVGQLLLALVADDEFTPDPEVPDGA